MERRDERRKEEGGVERGEKALPMERKVSISVASDWDRGGWRGC